MSLPALRLPESDDGTHHLPVPMQLIIGVSNGRLNCSDRASAFPKSSVKMQARVDASNYDIISAPRNLTIVLIKHQKTRSSGKCNRLAVPVKVELSLTRSVFLATQCGLYKICTVSNPKVSEAQPTPSCLPSRVQTPYYS